MGFNLNKALHALVGFTPVGAQVGRNAATGMGRRGKQNVHPPSPSKPQIADFNKRLVDINNQAGTPLPIQPGSITNENPDGTWLRQQLGLQVAQPRVGFGATDTQVQGGGLNPIDPQFGAVGNYQQMRSIQGGNFNPGSGSLQDRRPVRYRQGPQPAQSWYDF